MINKFQTGSIALDDFLNQNNQRHVWVNGDETVVYTGDDLPEMPREFISVTPRQFRQALTHSGLRSSVEALIASADQDVQDWYEYGTSFENTHPVINEMAAYLNHSESDVDALFRSASQL